MTIPEPATPDPERRRRRSRGAGTVGLLAILALHVALAGAFLRTVPPFNWPDEPAHLNYVRELASGRGLAVMDRSSWAPARLEELKRDHFEGVDPSGEAIAGIRYEAHQPPLYYVLGAAVLRAAPVASELVFLRALNLALSCAVLVVTLVAGRSLFAEAPAIAWAAALFSAVVPMRCFMAVSIGNGVAAELVLGFLLLALARGARPLVVGTILGLGLWVHLAVLLGLPLYAVWLWLGPSTRARAAGVTDLPVSRPRQWAVATVLALALASPWMLRNVSLYGWDDPLALGSGALGSAEAERQALGAARPTLGLAGPHGLAEFGRLTFVSFWGVFGWMEMFYDRRIQLLFAVLAAAALAGVVRLVVFGAGEPFALGTRRKLAALASFPLLVALALVAYGTADFQPQGRYLHLVSPAIALLWAAGARCLFGGFFRPWLAASIAALAAVSLYGAVYVVPWYLAR